MRKPIQLIVVNNSLVALCDDGTIWVMSDNGKKWIQTAEMPQLNKTQRRPLTGCLDSQGVSTVYTWEEK